ncbi:hypothetical protein SAMN05216203_2837 [Marinobacter daqiaonensis]|uniref:Uncharacterized protein n=1 Tax=Marinobacter daqiaonensis TaxID=650891 RepID=A0A1I6JAU0_9GAMM|nr:hypothetical protein [Marinobacter daqiaonensis]SFR76022.1 hypothetical protein SAMN05216203_2837 [Marinobacter daqiaonensis]
MFSTLLVSAVVSGLGCTARGPSGVSLEEQAQACESLPRYERRECIERLPPLHETIDLRQRN